MHQPFIAMINNNSINHLWPQQAIMQAQPRQARTSTNMNQRRVLRTWTFEDGSERDRQHDNEAPKPTTNCDKVQKV